MYLFKTLLKSLFPVVYAIDKKDERLLKQLLKAGADVNKPDRFGHPPVQLSYISDLDKFSYLLLEHGANPNAISPNLIDKSCLPLLQYRINNKDYAHAKMLILYGASLDTITFPKFVPVNIKELLIETQKLYREVIAPFKGQDTLQAYQRLADVWQQLSQAEKNPTLKECYQMKADSYREKIQAKEANAVSDIGLTVAKFKQL